MRLSNLSINYYSWLPDLTYLIATTFDCDYEVLGYVS